MNQWKTIVSVPSPVSNSQGIPTVMHCDAPNAVVARAYFEKFGKVIGEVKIVNK